MVNIINEQGKVERLSLNPTHLSQARSSQLQLAGLELPNKLDWVTFENLVLANKGHAFYLRGA